jgi:type II restriction/modification system DNA methylase subunit YeeA
MNTSQLKTYAPRARTEFIRAVTDRAERFGLSKTKTDPVTVEGDVAIIGGVAHPRQVAEQRAKLEERITVEGFDQVMESVAYTWFNRFAAIRYMELHGFLDHGYRVLSHPAGNEQPEILEHAAEIDLPELDRDRVVELKLDGTKDDELYRLLLLAHCNALHKAMPFLFEEIGDADELLLPVNLLHTDSLIRQLVEQIDEDFWQDIEIIGWLYQFYISEKKDQVIGKVVKSEDIPAATQLFTPNWIVKYMVQNSLGAQWLATYPDSALKEQMEYYIEPAEQTDEVNAQLAAITPSTLNPEELTLIDPASGSGHILVEAYELFKAIYLERGYRQRDVPQLILDKNLFGLDIDERAAQLTGFALMMKGRADDRRLFERGVKLNVMALVDSAGFDAEGLAKGVELGDYGLNPGDLTELKRLFEHATTFGSLIQVPEGLAEKLAALKQLSELTSQDLFVSEALKRLGPLVEQAESLAAQYDAVVANPPYMGSKYMNALAKKFAKSNFPDSKIDLFACFIERGLTLSRGDGHSAMVTMQSWMFLSSYANLRKRILQEKTIRTMAHLGARAFGSISGEVVQTTAFILKASSVPGYRPVFFRLVEGGEAEKRAALRGREARFDSTSQDEFKDMPGCPVAYWVSEGVRSVYKNATPLRDIAIPRAGNTTTDNDRFVRFWWEVDHPGIGFVAGSVREFTGGGFKWAPYHKGGGSRKWHGLDLCVVNWENDGAEIRAIPHSVVANANMYFQPGITWSTVSTNPIPGFRRYGNGFVFDNKGACIRVVLDEEAFFIIGVLNSRLIEALVAEVTPTISLQPGDIAKMPVVELSKEVRRAVAENSKQAIGVAKWDWDLAELSWCFAANHLIDSDEQGSLPGRFAAFLSETNVKRRALQGFQSRNNELLIDAYGLADELTPEVPIEQITLTVNPAYRYGGKLTEEELWTRFRQDTCEELVSYAIGCMMGRYSLDEPGLIYAHSGNEGFDASKYTSFPADDDGIVPLTDTEWFDDDACKRVIEFISVAFPGEEDAAHLAANLAFLADNLSPKRNEPSRETLRRYLCDSFFKDHLQTYKKRPIYWLFSSGKRKAFQCLVYLHRYNEGTLARMRTEYAIPLQGKLSARIDHLEDEIAAAASTSQRTKLEKRHGTLRKQLEELRMFDEKLRHYADKRISLDLDDGVKVNYSKFGDLLASVKDVTGKKVEVE